MRQILVNVYEFYELSDHSKDVARQNYLNEILSDNWWENIYEDANLVGLDITGFELDRGYDITGNFLSGAMNCAHAIILTHDTEGETYKIAQDFINYSLNEDEDDCVVFLRNILRAYQTMLLDEDEYINSNEYIDMVLAESEHNYEFYENGKLV